MRRTGGSEGGRGYGSVWGGRRVETIQRTKHFSIFTYIVLSFL